jgi:hypothetical protein
MDASERRRETADEIDQIDIGYLEKADTIPGLDIRDQDAECGIYGSLLLGWMLKLEVAVAQTRAYH